MEENINKEVSEMLKLNIIEPSESPFCSTVVIDPKKDSTNRFCVDYRLLYNQTVFDSEPIPDSEEMFSKLAGHLGSLQHPLHFHALCVGFFLRWITLITSLMISLCIQSHLSSI